MLEGFRFHRLLSVPHRRDDPDHERATSAQLVAALTAAHAELAGEADRPAIALAWERLAGRDQLRVLVGGRPLFPPAGDARGGRHPLGYPPGAQGEVVAADEVLDGWAGVPYWVRCAGVSDPLWTVDSDLRRGGFDDCVAHLISPFVWLVVAEPLPTALLERELGALTAQIPRLRLRENSELDRVALERAQGRYRELSRARAVGLWAVHVLVGADTAAAAQSAAAVLCSSGDLDNHPYVLLRGAATGDLDHAWRATIETPDGPCSPFPATCDVLAALARPPRRELPGIRLIERADFDLTPEHTGDGVHLGQIKTDTDASAGPFKVSAGTLNRHTFVTGATGAGKSQTVRHLLEELHSAGIPWLVIEPAKSEYARMAGRIGGEHVVVLRPGDPDEIPAGLNPLQPEPGFPLQTHIDLVRALFLAAFEAHEPFPQVLAQALTRCYTELGWDLVLSESRIAGVTPKYPSLVDLQRVAHDVVSGIGYGKEITDNVRGFIDIRIGSLRLGTPGRFFEGPYHIDMADLLCRNVVLAIEDVGNDQDKAFFIGTVLIRLYEHLRVNRHDAGQALRHITVIEEAHRLLKRVESGSPAAHAVELFTGLLAETRAYGEGIVVAEQIPAKIVPDVLKNTALKIVHRLPAGDDRADVGATMNLDETQSRQVTSLPPGVAVVFADGMDRPMRIAVPLGENREDARSASHAVAVYDRTTLRLTGDRCYLLRELSLSARVAEDPRLIVWIELFTTAHLVGRPEPAPRKWWLDELRLLADRRTLDCAIALRVQSAVDDRYTELIKYYQPESLADHLVGCARDRLGDVGVPCDGSEAEWQAGRHRWADVRAALADAATAPPGPHPETSVWASRGLHLAGDSQLKQRAALLRHPDSWLAPTTTITGSGSCARAVARLSPDTDVKKQLSEATRHLQLTTTWPLTRGPLRRDGKEPR